MSSVIVVTREDLSMRALIVIFLLLSVSAAAEPRLNLTPPAGATFAPGQRFDVRLEANDIRGKPQGYSIFLNGRDVTREIFGGAEFQTFPLLDATGRATALLGGGITGRGWSLRSSGRYELAATLTDADGYPTATEQAVVTSGEHTATDIFIAASGPGSRLFGTVMDNTEVFFKILQAVGYK